MRVQLPAELAHVRHPQGVDGHEADGDGARGEVRETRVGDVVARQRREDVARPGSPQREADPAGCDVVEQHAAVIGQVPPQPAQVVLPDRGPGDHQVAVGRDPGHRQVALDAAALVEQLRVDDPADRYVHVVRAQPLEERDRTRTDDLDLGERALIEQAGRLPGRQRLGADRG